MPLLQVLFQEFAESTEALVLSHVRQLVNDMNRFRTSPTSTEAMVKFCGTGMPCGRDANRISRLIVLPIVPFFSRQNHATAYQVRRMGLPPESSR